MLKFQTVVAVFSIVLSLDSILERSFHLLRLSCPSDNSQKCRRILRKEGTSDISSLSVGGLHQVNISLPAEFKTYIQRGLYFSDFIASPQSRRYRNCKLFNNSN